MFDWVHNNKRIIQIILFLIMLPFAFFGIDTYFRNSESTATVASIGDQKITQQEFANALRERQEALTKAMGGRVDRSMLDSPEMRFAVIEGIVRQRLLLSHAFRQGLNVPDAELQEQISGFPAFQQDGKFSLSRYQALLKAQNLSPVSFETQMRRDAMVQQLTGSIAETGFVASAVGDRLIRLSEQTRDVSVVTLKAEAYASQVRVDDAAAKTFYDGNVAQFRIPEQARIEYVVLSADALGAELTVDPDEVRKTFEANVRQFQRPEQRQASHILLKTEPGASADARVAARKEAESLLKQVQASPSRFAELAKKHSQDPGSANQGGDLGLFGRGTMTKAFEDAVFGMKEGEVAGPVETEFGFHVIRLVAVAAAGGRFFDEVKGQIEADLRKQKAGQQFAKVADQFNDMVYTQSDSLKPVADQLKLRIQKSDWISREGAGGALGNDRLLAAVFSEDVLKNKRNTEAIEVAPTTLVAARVVEHKPSTQRPFDEVRTDIVQRLTREQAVQLAVKDGRERLDRLRKGEATDVAWPAAQTITRASTALGEVVLRQAYRVDATRMPAHAGAELPGEGFALIRVTRVADPESIAADKRTQLAEQLRQLIGQEQFSAFVTSLKQRSDVKVRQDALEKKDR
jgi:peptidyl-prolyl cis-trans isomerase D